MSPSAPAKRRAVAYIDGYNIYHAIRDTHRKDYQWLNLWDAARALLNSRDQELVAVKMFSAIAKHRPDSAARHHIYNQALASVGVEVILGNFKDRTTYCRYCKKSWPHPEEKESDVNLSIHLLRDCLRGDVDVAYIWSTDSDIAPAIRMAHGECKSTEFITVAACQRPHSKDNLSACQNKSAKLTEKVIRRNLFPEIIRGADGAQICVRPQEYAPPY